MNPILLESLRQFEAHYREDPRVLGMALHGSIGRGQTDAYSDVDVALIIRDPCYEEMSAELRPLCERLCGPIRAWLPEGAQEGFCNYAFLFEAGGELLLYDFEIATESAFMRMQMRPDRILFDPTGLLQKAMETIQPPAFTADILRQALNVYWVYASLSGKYYRRADLYKLLYVQDVLFQHHMHVLNALYSPTRWHWWAGAIQELPAEKRNTMMVYFTARSLEDIRTALAAEFALFSPDAREACRRWEVDYPADEEVAVIGHLRAMGALL